MRDQVWPFFILMFAGQMGWLLASTSAEKWLRENDPSFEPAGFLGRLFIGRLFTSFGPMSRYGKLRRERGEPTTLVIVFWVGFAVSILALIGLLLSLG
jgi:hypothetical protein